MQMNEQRVAIVTGANKGLGLAVAENFVKEGKKVVFVIRNKENLEQTRQRFQRKKYRSKSCSSNWMYLTLTELKVLSTKS